MSYSDTFNQAKKKYGFGGGGFFSIADGETKKIRIVSNAVQFETPNKFSDKGEMSVKFMVYVIDREDGKIKPWTMPVSVMNQLADLQISDEFGFKTALPPYDMVLTRKKENSIVKYNLLGSRKDTALNDQEIQAIEKLKPVSDIVDKIVAKQSNVLVEEPISEPVKSDFEKGLEEDIKNAPPLPTQDDGEINIEDIPF